MKRILTSAALSLACLAVLAGSAGANGFRPYGRAAVPVPAPYPVPDGPSGWYLRADIGLARQSDESASERGLVYGAGNGFTSSSVTGAGFGSSSSWFNKDFDTTITYGVGVGYHWSTYWRSDLTIERRGNAEYRMRGNYRYQQHFADPPPLPPAPLTYSADPNLVVNGVTSDTTSLKSGVFMANTYYDWKNRSAFTPYVGAGLGIAYLTLDRQHTTIESECNATTDPTCALQTVLPARSFSAAGDVTRLTFAGALTTGFSYAITPVTSVDVNYRFLYIPGSNIDIIVNGNQSRLSFADITEHQLRAGLRWDIN